jgi:hypothetical protein
LLSPHPTFLLKLFELAPQENLFLFDSLSIETMNHNNEITFQCVPQFPFSQCIALL